MCIRVRINSKTKWRRENKGDYKGKAEREANRNRDNAQPPPAQEFRNNAEEEQNPQQPNLEGVRGFTAAQLAAIVQAMHPIMGAVTRNEQGQGGFNLKPYGQVLDTSTKRGSELYGQAIRKLEPTFDGEQEKLRAFVDKIRQRVSHLNCTEIFNSPIVDVLGAERLMYNLFEDYTTITLNQTRNATIARWSVNNWQKQASYIMGLATLESLGENFRSCVADQQEKYSIADNKVQCVDSPLLLKTIHTLVQPETGYSAFTLIQELNRITLENHDNNVINLNELKS